MTIVFKVTIKSGTPPEPFTLIWENMATHTTETTATITPDDVEKNWQHPRFQLAVGLKLFSFLNGEKHLLQQAMDHAAQQGEKLTLLLCPDKRTADWPFELMAQENSFLLTERLHLVRCVSDWGTENKMIPQDRPLKLLFMACSALDIKPELDFEREEETIFNVTANLPIDMEVEDSGSLEGLRDQLLKNSYDIVHLSGHADIDNQGRPFFIMETETGAERKVFTEELWQQALIENPPHLLFLSGCRTGETPDSRDMHDSEKEATVSFAHELVEEYNIPAVIGWGRSVSDQQASHAEQMLYRELSRGKSIPEAVMRARHELLHKFDSSSHPAWSLLRLFGNGESMAALIKTNQKAKPKPRSMTHIYLQESQVRVLEQGFIGRRRQIQQSLRALKQNQNKVGVLLLGTGGLGKSCLGGKLCERFNDHTPIVVYGKLNAITMEKALEKAFLVTKDESGEKILAEHLEMKKKLAKLCTTSFKEKNYLLLLDDFEQNLEGVTQGEPGELLLEAKDLLAVLLEYLPYSGKQTQLIVTSRYGFSLTDPLGHDAVAKRLDKVWLTGFLEAELRKKERELIHIYCYPDLSTRTELLIAGMGNPRLMEWLNKLVEQMNGVEVTQLLEAVRDKQEEFIRKHVIRELLERGGANLAEFLRCFSIYRIPVEMEGARLVAEKAGVANWQALLNRSLDLSLVEHLQARQSFCVTPLLQDELLSGLVGEKERDAHAAAFDYYGIICTAKGDKIYPILVEEWIYHALACGEVDAAPCLGGRLVNYLRECLAYMESQRVGEWVLLERKRKHLAFSKEFGAFLLTETATTILTLGDYSKAISYYQQALAINVAVFGNQHTNVAIVLNNLGEAWRKYDNPRKAINYYQQALTINLAVFGKQHDIVAGGINNLGLAWKSLGKFKEAIDYFQQSLTIWKSIYGENHPQVAIGMNNLGSAWKSLGKFKKAIDYFQQSLTIDREVFGEQHPKVAIRLNNLGTAYLSRGQIEIAKSYFENAQAIYKQFFEDDHPDVKNVAESLGRCARSEKPKTFSKSLFYYLRSLRDRIFS